VRPGEPVVLHYVYRDPDGPIASPGLPALGVEPCRLRVACWPGRPSLLNFPATDLPSAVSCPDCRRSRAFLALPEAERGARPQHDRESTAPEVLALLEGE
jgi:hypothetical protein